MALKPPLRNWCVLAIDPGRSPTICAVWDRGESAKWYDPEHTGGNYKRERPHATTKHREDQPSGARIRHIMEYHDPDLVVIEKVWVRPVKDFLRSDGKAKRGQGVVSQAKLVACMYICDGIACGLGLNILRVFPQTWMKFHGLITKDKAYHRSFAARKAPKWAWAFARIKDHDRADAFLMALMGMAFLDQAYERAVRKGAPLDHTPIIDTVR